MTKSNETEQKFNLFWYLYWANIVIRRHFWSNLDTNCMISHTSLVNAPFILKIPNRHPFSNLYTEVLHNHSGTMYNAVGTHYSD